MLYSICFFRHASRPTSHVGAPAGGFLTPATAGAVPISLTMASNAAIEGMSGAMGGIIALLSTYPLMTVRQLALLIFLLNWTSFCIGAPPSSTTPTLLAAAPQSGTAASCTHLQDSLLLHATVCSSTTEAASCSSLWPERTQQSHCPSNQRNTFPAVSTRSPDFMPCKDDTVTRPALRWECQALQMVMAAPATCQGLHGACCRSPQCRRHGASARRRASQQMRSPCRCQGRGRLVLWPTSQRWVFLGTADHIHNNDVCKHSGVS